MASTKPGPQVVWRKSSHSNAAGGACVEVALSTPGVVPVRDSKCGADGGVLSVPYAAWEPFLRHLRAAPYSSYPS